MTPRSPKASCEKCVVNTKYLLQSHDGAVGTDSLMHAISVHIMTFIEDFCVLVNGTGAVGQGRHFLLIVSPRSGGESGGEAGLGGQLREKNGGQRLWKL